MPRRLRSFLLFLPMALLVLVLLLWARSYLPDQTLIRSNRGCVVLLLVPGHYVTLFDDPNGRFRSTNVAINYCRQLAYANSRPDLRFAGFEWTNLDFKSTDPGFIVIPYWAIALLPAALSTWAILRYRSQRQRLLPGHCTACGYDLRASHEKCPECGTPATTPPRSQATSPAAIG